VTNSVNSHRPLHEQESIEREIRKNSRVGTSGTLKQMTSPRLKGPPVSAGIQLPMQGKHIQKVYMLKDICLSQKAHHTFEQLQ
jgi:hypothetical protein